MNVEEPSTPELDDLQQNNEREAPFEVPVRVVDIGPVDAHILPSRASVMRSIAVSEDTQSVLGRDLRRKRLQLWATSADTAGYVYVGTDQNEVESGSAAMLPAVLDTLAEGAPMVLDMTHCNQVWVRAAQAAPVQLSYVAEYWAD